MNWAYHVKSKMKAVSVLMLIIVLILATNLSNRKTFTDLDHSIASIYKDRLLPSTYIFQITDHLYQKRLMNENGSTGTMNEEQHTKAIASLIKTYETTYLTSAEKQEWGAFKKNLVQYDILNAQVNKDEAAIANSFNKALQCLSTLSNIQASEGKHIQASSENIVNGTIITSELEIALLMILGIFALVLVSAGDNRMFQQSQKPLLN